MPDTLPSLTVRKSLTVEASCAHAFTVFTTGFDSWWPRAHHIGKADLLPAVIEPLSWHLNGQWQCDPDPASVGAEQLRAAWIPTADGTGCARCSPPKHRNRRLEG